jgi:hypothetical protein
MMGALLEFVIIVHHAACVLEGLTLESLVRITLQVDKVHKSAGDGGKAPPLRAGRARSEYRRARKVLTKYRNIPPSFTLGKPDRR